MWWWEPQLAVCFQTAKLQVFSISSMIWRFFSHGEKWKKLARFTTSCCLCDSAFSCEQTHSSRFCQKTTCFSSRFCQKTVVFSSRFCQKQLIYGGVFFPELRIIAYVAPATPLPFKGRGRGGVLYPRILVYPKNRFGLRLLVYPFIRFLVITPQAASATCPLSPLSPLSP